MSTAREIAKEIIKPINDPFLEQRIVNAIEAERAARVVSESEMRAFITPHLKNFMAGVLSEKELLIFQSCSDKTREELFENQIKIAHAFCHGAETGFRAAASMNAIAHLESVMPSNKEIEKTYRSLLRNYVGDPGFIIGANWLRAEVLRRLGGK